MSSNRTVATGLGVVAAVLLFYLVNPWFNPEAGTTLNQIVTAGFWVAFLGLLVVLYQLREEPRAERRDAGAGLPRFLFTDTPAALFWLPIRLYVGLEWLEAGLHKFRARLDRRFGTALLGFWTAPSRSRPEAAADHYEWYRASSSSCIDNNAQAGFLVIMLGELLSASAWCSAS